MATPERDPLEQLDEEEAAETAAEPEPTSPLEGGEGEDIEEPDEEPRQWAGKFQSAEDLEQSYTELQQQLGRMGNELGQLRAQLQGGGGGQQQPQQPEAEPQITREQWEEWAAEDPWAANQWLAAQTAFQVQAMQQQQLAPVLASVNRSEAAATIDRLRQDFGDEVVKANREAVAAAIQADDGYFMDPDTRYQRLALTLKAAEYDRAGRQDSRRPRRSNGQYARAPHQEGGSTPQPSEATSELDPVIEEMEASAPRGDRFGHGPGSRLI
jgi:hypothetical protein